MTEVPTETTGAGDGSAGDHAATLDRIAGDLAATLDRIAGDLAAVEAAMRRLDDGTYGRCEACGAEIPEEQLSSDPLRTRCVQHGGGPAAVSEGPVAVLSGDDPLALGSEHPEG